MLRRLLLSTAFLAAILACANIANASDTCQRYTGGKCKAVEKTPPKLRSGVSTQQQTQPPAKGNHKGRDEYTPAQREKFMAEARALCRKKFGAPSRVYRIDYKKNQIWCEPPAY
jgi:hypothetical protein